MKSWVGLITCFFVLITCVGHAISEIAPRKMIQREENSTDFPYSDYRERSTQRITYNHLGQYLVSEFDFKHTTFKYRHQGIIDENKFFQASLTGRNLTNSLSFKAGRIWAGNDSFRPMDGASWHYYFGKRLSGTFTLAKTPILGRDMNAPKPTITEGRLHYRFNDTTFMAVQSNQDVKDLYSSTLLGYNIDSLLALAEYRTSGATDTYRLSLQLFDIKKFDLTSDYRVNMKSGYNTGIFRNTIATTIGTCYFETSLGRKFVFGKEASPNTSFYEGLVFWGEPRLNESNLCLGYLLEITPKVESRTISGEVEKAMSKNTKVSLGLADTKFNDGRESIQNISSRLRRKVHWGFYELLFSLITDGQPGNLKQDYSLKAGYEF